MKRLFFIVIVLCFSKVNAQINEIGVFLGGSNFIGDVGKTTYIAPNEIAFGLLYKWNRSPRHAYRFSLIQSTLSGNDLDSDVPGRKERGLNFENSITEVSAGLEFNFFDFNLHELTPKLTPYVFTGLTYTFYDGLFFVGDKAKSDSKHGTIGIPMIVGIKTNIMPKLILAVEVGARYTFADDIDGSNPTNENLQLQKFGNINSNDWYTFSGLTLTYTFGDKPCYCAD
ncbi:MAG: DUF6089 family protein [Bacteroidota bacterium]